MHLQASDEPKSIAHLLIRRSIYVNGTIQLCRFTSLLPRRSGHCRFHLLGRNLYRAPQCLSSGTRKVSETCRIHQHIPADRLNDIALANIPHHLPYAVKVPHVTSDSYSAMLHQQPYYSAQDLVNPLGQRIATLRPSYLHSDRQVYQDVES